MLSFCWTNIPGLALTKFDLIILYRLNWQSSRVSWEVNRGFVTQGGQSVAITKHKPSILAKGKIPPNYHLGCGRHLNRELWIYQQIIIIFWFDNPQIVTLMEFWSRLRSFLQLLTPAISDCWMVIMNVTKDFIEIQASKTINRWNLSGMDWSGICSALVPVWYIPSCICHLISAISCQKCKMLQNVLFFSLAYSPIACCTQPHSQKCVFCTPCMWNPLVL